MLSRTFQKSNHILSPFDILTLVTSLSILSTWEKGYCKTVEVAFSEHHLSIPLIFEKNKKFGNNLILWNKTSLQRNWRSTLNFFLAFFTEGSVSVKSHDKYSAAAASKLIHYSLQLVAEVFSNKDDCLTNFFSTASNTPIFSWRLWNIQDKAKRVLFLTIDKFQFYSLKSFCLRDRGRLGNEGQPILLKFGTQMCYVDLCNMPKF